VAHSGNVKLLSTADWTPLGTLPSLQAAATDLTVSPDGSHVLISLLNGSLARRELRSAAVPQQTARSEHQRVEDVFVDTGTPPILEESALRQSQQLASATGAGAAMQLPRGAEVTGTIADPDEEDWFAFQAYAGE